MTARLVITATCLILAASPSPPACADCGHNFYPALLDEPPGLDSPQTLDDGTEVIVALTRDDGFALIPVTPENGEPYVYGQGTGLGRQLEVDGEDFPTLARTGLHSYDELANTKTVTGRTTAEITRIGRPNMASGAGFMAADEDLRSVLAGDNRLVAAMGLRHPELARPLLHVLNSILAQRRAINAGQRPWGEVVAIRYNGRRVEVQWSSTKGWQESIFDDEIYGGYHINVSRALDPGELRFLQLCYPQLDEAEIGALAAELSSFHIGEMVPFYIMRYGFYEGHTDYRADPLAIALIFGLRSLEELESVFPGRLPDVLHTHHTRREGGGS